MYNRVTLIGTLGKKPDIRDINGKRVANMSLATWESRQNEQGEWVKDTTWHTVTVWNNAVKMIESAEQGDLLLVDGKITVRNYKGETNEMHKVTAIVGIARVLRRKNAQQGTAANPTQPQNVQNGGSSAPKGREEFDDDLPF